MNFKHSLLSLLAPAMLIACRAEPSLEPDPTGQAVEHRATDAMTDTSATSRVPAIDAAAPGAYETATFALG